MENNGVPEFFERIIVKAEEVGEARKLFRNIKTTFQAMQDEEYSEEEIRIFFSTIGKGAMDGLIDLWLKR